MGLAGQLGRLFDAACWWLWPETCAACGTTLPESSLLFCPLCAGTVVPISPPLCPTCFLPFDSGPSHLCLRCSTDPPPFDRAVAIFEYGGAVAEAIRQLKYRPAPWLARRLGRLMGPHLAALEPDIVCPVPTHPTTLRRRGFDHTFELARWACRAARLPPPRRLLVRRGEARPQAAKSLAERRRLGPSAFALRAEAPTGRVVLLDDVVTTTATARAAATQLVRAGSEVTILALARTVL